MFLIIFLVCLTIGALVGNFAISLLQKYNGSFALENTEIKLESGFSTTLNDSASVLKGMNRVRVFFNWSSLILTLGVLLAPLFYRNSFYFYFVFLYGTLVPTLIINYPPHVMKIVKKEYRNLK